MSLGTLTVRRERDFGRIDIVFNFCGAVILENHVDFRGETDQAEEG